MNTTNKSDQIWESLCDPEFRKQFIDEHISVGIAFQIRSLRNRQKLTQTKLAELLGGKQPLISEWENPSYGNYTLGTMKDLAKAFDVGLLVRFVPYSTLVDWTINLTSDVIAPPSFSEENKYYIPASTSAVATTVGDIKDTKDTDAYDLTLLINKQLAINNRLAANRPILNIASTAQNIASTAQTEKELQYA